MFRLYEITKFVVLMTRVQNNQPEYEMVEERGGEMKDNILATVAERPRMNVVLKIDFRKTRRADNISSEKNRNRIFENCIVNRTVELQIANNRGESSRPYLAHSNSDSSILIG